MESFSLPVKNEHKAQSINALYKKVFLRIIFLLFLLLCISPVLKAQPGGVCNPNNPHYDPCQCGDPRCNNAPIDSWIVYMVTGATILGLFRIKGTNSTTDVPEL